MARLYLVRHGEAAASWAEAADPGLSARGLAQAEQAAIALADRGVTTILSSPLARAMATAAPLAARLELPVAIDRRYRELPSTVPLPERAAWLAGIMRARWDEVGAELGAWRDEAWHSLLGCSQVTAVFTHFMLINAVVSRATSAVQTVCFEPDNGSITELEVTADAIEVVRLGAVRATHVL